MKKFLLILCFFISLAVQAQTPIVPPCAADDVMKEQMLKDPEFKRMVEQVEQQLQEYMKDQKGKKVATGGPVYTIPVVAHLIYTSQTDCTPSALNITNDKIRKAFDVASANMNARPATKYVGYARYSSPTNPMYSADSTGIKFCLATKGPANKDGTGAIIDYPTGAVLRYDGALAATWAATASPSANATAYLGYGVKRSGANGVAAADVWKVGAWNVQKYYNVYLVSQIDGNKGGSGVQGWASYPSSSPVANDHSVMLIKDFNGPSGGGAGTFTHEMGHAINLKHTFEGSSDAGGGPGGSCPPNTDCVTQGDNVCDTPPAPGYLGVSCTGKDDDANPCHATSLMGDIIHNYMNYSNCDNMFTAGQAARMRTVLSATTTNRNKQVQPANVTYCGCDGTNKPSVAFSANPTSPCIGTAGSLVDESLYSPPGSTWSWTITPASFTYSGGTSSATQNPLVIFNTAGPYTVKLKVTNAYGSDSLTKINYIVPITSATVPFVEGFENPTFPPTQWSRTTSITSQDSLWKRTTTASGFSNSTACAVLPNTGFPSVGFNGLTSPSINLSGTTKPRLTFDVAYQRYYSSPTDSLNVYYSTDCGITFTRTNYKKGYSNLRTSSAGSYATFVPNVTQWRKDTVDLTFLIGQSAVVFKFERGDDASNYLYLDNINIAEPPAANFTGTPASICAGDSVQFTDASTASPNAWTWTFSPSAGVTFLAGTNANSQNPKVKFANSGFYSVTLVASNAAGNSTPFTRTDYVTVNAVPSAVVSPSNPSICLNQSATLSVPGGATTYAWTGGGSTNSIVVNPAVNTSYSVTVSSSGCTATGSVLVTVNSLPLADAGRDTTICPDRSTPIGSSSIPGNTYSWNNFGTLSDGAISNPIATPNATTTYTVLVTNGNSCTASSDVVVTLFNRPVPVITPSQNPVCSGQTATLTSSPAVTYAWSTSQSTSQITIAPMVATTYTLTVTDVNGCSSLPTSIPITVSGPQADFSNTTVCKGSATNFSDQSTPLGAAVKWHWNFGTGSASDTANGKNSVFTYLTGGTYNVTLTVTDGAGCISTIAKPVTVNQAIANAGRDTIICPGRSVTLGSSPIAGSTYFWTNASTLNDPLAPMPVATPIAPTTTYSVDVQSLGGCRAKDTVTVNLFTAPTASISPADTIICGGSSATLRGSSSLGWTWSTGASTQNITVTPNDDSTYVLTVTDANTCTGTASILVTVAGPLADFSATAACVNNPTSFTDLSTGSPVKWRWNFGTANPADTSLLQNPTFPYPSSEAGTKTVSLKATDINGCFSIVTKSVTVNSAYPDAGPDTTICPGVSVVIGSATIPGSTYAWAATPDLNNLSISNPIATPIANATYTVTVTSAEGCVETDQVEVTLYSRPIAVINITGANPICPGDPTSLTANLASSYTWSTSDITQSINVNPLTTTSYSLVVTDALGCSSLPDISSISVNNPVADFTNNIACVSSPPPFNITSFTDASTGGPVSWAWDFDFAGNTDNVQNPTFTYTVANTYNVSLTITDALGCTATVVKPVVASDTPPDGDFSVPPAGCSKRDVQFTDLTPAATSWLWAFGDAQTSTLKNPLHIYAASGTYNVSLTVTNGCGTDPSPKVLAVTIYKTPNANAGRDTSICLGDTVRIGKTVNPSFNYQWSPPDFLDFDFVSQPNAAPTVSTTYIETVTDPTENNCNAKDTIAVSLFNPPFASISPNDTTICRLSTIRLTANDGLSWAWSSGDVSKFIDVTPGVTTTYTVTVTSECGTATASRVITVDQPIAIISPPGALVICPGTSQKLWSANPETFYKWSTGAADDGKDTIIVSPVSGSTNYYLTITDALGCTASSSAKVVNVNTPVATITATNPPGASGMNLCAGSTVDLEANPLLPPFSYKWYPNLETTRKITVSATGTYTVVTTNDRNCSKTSSPFVVNVGAQTAKITPAGPTTFCSGDSVTLMANSGASNYQWSNSTSSQSITVTTMGKYYVTVTFPGNCTSRDSIFVDVKDLPLASISTSSIKPNDCEGDTVKLTAMTNIANAGYFWSNGQASKTIGLKDVGSGTYIVTVTNLNDGCFKVSAPITVTLHPKPIALITLKPNATAICNGDTLRLIPSQHNGTVWYPGNIHNVDTLKVTQPGTYSVVINDNLGCTALSPSVTVVVNANPIVNVIANGPTTFCERASTLNLHANVNVLTTYVWSNGQFTEDITVDSESTRLDKKYAVTVTDANGCTSEGLSPVVNVIAQPTTDIMAMGSTDICQFSSVELRANATGPSLTFQWQKNGVDLINETLNNYFATSTGNYRVIVKSTCADSISQTIPVNVSPVVQTDIFSLGSSRYCAGMDSVILVVPNSRGSAWEWYRDGILIPGADDSTYVVTQSGDYTVKVYPLSLVCSPNTSPNAYRVDFYPIPVATIAALGSTVICPGASVDLGADNGPGYNFQWRLDGMAIGTNTNVISVQDTGYYTIEVSNACGSDISSPIQVTWFEKPSAELTNSAASLFVCEGEPVILTPIISGSYTSISWRKDGVPIPNSNVVNLPVTQSGVYSLELTHQCGTDIAASAAVYIKPNPEFTLSPESPIMICEGEVKDLIAGSAIKYTWDWSTGQHTDTIVVKDPGIYTLTASISYTHPTELGLIRVCSGVKSATVKRDSSVMASFISTAMPNTNPPRVVFTNKSSESAIAFSWNFGDGSEMSTVRDPSHTYAAEGIYKVKLIAKNERGCRDSMIREVKTENDVQYMPNVFTPNDDGYNDFFMPISIAEDVKLLKGEIYDRWGKKMVEFEKAWNGKRGNGEDVPDGVYFFIVKLKLPDSNPNDPPYMEKGSVTIMRKSSR